MDIVDAWMQHPTPGFMAHPVFETVLRWMKVEQLPDEIPIEWTVAAMDAAGVSQGLLSAWWGPDGPLLSNDQVAEWCKRFPDRLFGVASVDLNRPVAAVAELRRCVEELGFKGLRILPWLWGLPPNDRRYYPLYVACVELNIPFCLQVGHAGPRMPSEPGRPIPYLDQVAYDFPELTIIGGHIGYPWTEEMISLATKYPNVYIDASAYKPSRYPAAFSAYLRRSKSKKVLFASNYPMIQPAACVAELDSLGLDEAGSGRFCAGNARRLFRLPGG
jgi:uncharacterized protein